MGDRVANRLGARGEDLAVAELQRQGMTVLARNWRCRTGEIDIVARETVDGRSTIVFCEVKCRSGIGFGDPLEAITYAKLRKLRQLAAEWLAENAEPFGSPGVRPVRLDAIGVLLVRGSAPVIRHLRGIGG
ncbi:MAG TPA: YraN family protein [Microlunatus sp.]|nr:YraN family protein [Microlunatus sp.]